MKGIINGTIKVKTICGHLKMGINFLNTSCMNLATRHEDRVSEVKKITKGDLKEKLRMPCLADCSGREDGD